MLTGGAVYLVIAVAAVAAMLSRSGRPRASRVAASAAALTGASLVLGLMSLAVPESQAGDDVATWLLLVWLLVFLGGLALIVRSALRATSLPRSF